MIGIGEVRLGHWIQSKEFDGTVANWYHPDCFFRKFPVGTPSCPITTSTQIGGIWDLKWKDMTRIAVTNMHEEEFSHGRTPSTKKLFAVRSALRSALDTFDLQDLKGLLEHNGQAAGPGSGKKEVVQRCIDGMLYGALPPCPVCKTSGTLYWDMDLGTYRCAADASEWAHCPFELKEFNGLKRTKWTMIQGFSGMPFLDNWTQPDDPTNVVLPAEFNYDDNDDDDDTSTQQPTQSLFGGMVPPMMPGGGGFNLFEYNNSEVEDLSSLFMPIEPGSETKANTSKATSTTSTTTTAIPGGLFGATGPSLFSFGSSSSSSSSTSVPFLFSINNNSLGNQNQGQNDNNNGVKSKIFKGMYVYISNSAKYMMYKEIPKITSSGGVILSKFDKNIDLYVARSRTSSRIELICDWYDVPVVTPDYFKECFNRDTLLDPAYFEPDQYVNTLTIVPWKDYVPVRSRQKSKTKKKYAKSKPHKTSYDYEEEEEERSDEEIEDNNNDYSDYSDYSETPDDSDGGSGESGDDDDDDYENSEKFANPGGYFTGSMYDPLKATQPSDMQKLCDSTNFPVCKEFRGTEPTKDECECADPFSAYLARYGPSDGVFLNPDNSEPVFLLGPKSIKLSRCDAPFEPVSATAKGSPLSPSPKKGKKGTTTAPAKVPICKKAVNEETGLGDRYHVMAVAGGGDDNDGEQDIYNAVLSSSDIATQQNSYYYMQVLEPDVRGSAPYVVWMKWGRVGTTIGKSKVERTRSAGDAIKMFCEKYREKTLNSWDMRKSFRKMPRAFYPLDVDYSDDGSNNNNGGGGDNNSNDDEGGDSTVPSKLDRRVYKLVETLFDADKISREMASIGIDTTKMPLGKLKRETVMNGYTTLKEIEAIITNSGDDNDDNNSKLKLLGLSNKFYTIIPHSFGVGVSPPLIDSKELLLSKMSMMETLADIEVAACLMKKDSNSSNNNRESEEPLNPIDAKYHRMHVDLAPIEEGSTEWDFLRSAVRGTVPSACGFRLDLAQAFRVTRDGEQERFAPYAGADGRRLLWHGSRLTNYVGILSQGLRIAPPEAPVSGYMFGKGIYLADMGGKSAEYCHASPSSPHGIVLLCEAALGPDPLRLKSACYVEKERLEALGKESTMGLGRLNPAPCNNRVVKTKEGLLMRSGATVAMGPEEPSDAGSDCELEHNEFIVYDVSRVVIRYALEVSFTFTDGWEARDITYGLK